MGRPPKTPEERKATRSAANRRYYERHRADILAHRATTPAPDLWSALYYHPDLSDFVQSITNLGLPQKLYRNELTVLMRVIELISTEWEK